MRGIESALWGVLGKDPELKISKTGTPFTTMNVTVTVGKADDGKDVGQWIRIVCFGATAEQIAARAKKGDRVYCEGTLTQNTWTVANGDTRTGLNLAAWKVEKLAAIGKNRQFREKGHEPPPTGFKRIVEDYGANPDRPVATKYRRERPKIQGIDDFERGDDLPF